MEFGPSGLVLLHLNGEPYTQKPPLYYWLAAAAGAPFGRVTEVAARLPSALAGIALIGLTLVFGSRLLGGATATLGAALLLTTFEFADNARRAQLDVLLALFETLALVAFWRIDRGIGRRWLAQLVLHASLGLAVLTKGPVGILVPVLVMACFLALGATPPRAAPRVPVVGTSCSRSDRGSPGSRRRSRSRRPASSATPWSTNLFGASSRAAPTRARSTTTSTSSRPRSCPGPCSRPSCGGRHDAACSSRDGERRGPPRVALPARAWIAATLVFFSLSTRQARALPGAAAAGRRAAARGRARALGRGGAPHPGRVPRGDGRARSGRWSAAASGSRVRNPLHDETASLRGRRGDRR